MAIGTYGGSITLASVTDGSIGTTLYTWIRYSPNADGSNMTATPDANTKYIGIAYNKTSSTPSSSKSDYTWSKYVGEKGEEGRGISSVEIRYAIGNSGTTAPSDGWQQNVPSVPQGKYLWTRTITTYTTGNPTTTYSVSFFGVDGAEGLLYDIQSGHEKIYKFFSSSNSDVVFSPESMTFQVYKISDGQSNLMLTSEYDTDIALAGYTTDSNFGHLWNFLSRLTGQKKEQSGGQSENLLTVARVIGNDTVQFNFGILTNYSVTTALGNTDADVTAFNNFISLLKNDNGYFIYKIFRHKSALQPISSDLLAIKPIPFEFGTSEDMAKFALTANNIQMAVNESKLTFGTDGLTVQNGGFRIIGMDGSTTLMEYDPTGQALKIVGNGEFTGIIHANEGSFTGDVTANTLIANGGNIGGFVITQDGLYSKSGAEETSGGYDVTGSNIKLLGESGQIDAENINLGIGAHINKYIQLGDAILWNPIDADANGRLLDAGAIKLSQTGILQLGNITLDGVSSRIFGMSFSIAPDQATFNNVNVSGKISTAVFEQNHVQSVGGSMMFKPSYKIHSQAGNTVVIDKETTEDFSGNIGDYVYLIKQDGTTADGLIQIGRIDGNTITLSKQTPPDTLVSMVVLGKERDLIIGINSNNGPGPSNFLRPRGFTITEFTLAGTDGNKYVDMTQNPKVFLGDLDTSGINFMSDEITTKGFGLYSENVYLTGSLTTKILTTSEPKFAGVNTLNGALASKFTANIAPIPDGSRIVFWAGSASTKNEDIQIAPFQVTEQGSLYASQGVFEGAIISKSVIKGADIYAARIHGQSNNLPNSLTFYDASKGIIFKKGDYNGVGTDTSVEVFSIGEEGLRTKNKYFIHIGSSGYVEFIGDAIQIPEFFTDKTQTYFLHLKNNKIFGSHIGDNDLEEIQANIAFTEQKLSFGVKDNQEDLIIDSNEIQLNKEVVQMYKTVLFGEELKYEQVTNGYNLYVS